MSKTPKRKTQAKGILLNFKSVDYIVFAVTDGLGKPRGEALVRFPPVLYHSPGGKIEGVKKVVQAWNIIEEQNPEIKTYEVWGTYARVNYHELMHWLAEVSCSKKDWISVQPSSIGIFEVSGIKFFFYYVDIEVEESLDETFTTEETFSASEEDDVINEDED